MLVDLLPEVCDDTLLRNVNIIKFLMKGNKLVYSGYGVFRPPDDLRCGFKAGKVSEAK